LLNRFSSDVAIERRLYASTKAVNPQAESPAAWQPLTPAGVARFARASSGRLLLLQFVVALASASTVTWFLTSAWFPVITKSIQNLPAEGTIRGGSLEWAGPSPVVLAENRFLAVSVDLRHGGQLRFPAHIQVEFGRKDARIVSLAGYATIPYVEGQEVPFSQPKLEPWWGAWAPPLLGAAFLSVIAALMSTWFVLAILYAVPLWLSAFFADRELRIGGAWCLAGAALMPGALLMIVGILAYGLGLIDVVQLVGLGIGHVVLGWVYCVMSVLRTPVRVVKLKDNPFSSGGAPEPGITNVRSETGGGREPEGPTAIDANKEAGER
jgi:hypothetical protein